jgi:hypothetical protein
MLASCASGLTVVGIDKGFGAACAVLRLLGPPAGAGAPAEPSAAATRHLTQGRSVERLQGTSTLRPIPTAPASPEPAGDRSR